MKIAADSLHPPPHGAVQATPVAAAARPWVIQPWTTLPAEVVVYEYRARLDIGCCAAATEQIDKSRRLYNLLIGCMQTVHGDMNAWVLPPRL